MTLAKKFLDLKRGEQANTTDLIGFPVEHGGIQYVVFSDNSAISMREGVNTVEADSPVAIAFADGKAGVERRFPIGSVEAHAYESGGHVRAARSPEVKQRMADLLAGKVSP